MRINDRQMEKVLKNLGNLSASCQVCKHSGIKISDRIFELREFNDGNIVVGGDNSIMPLMFGICDNCGHIQLFSAVKLGAIDTSEKKVKDEDRESKKK